ncbi:MAG: SagB/ThcOx family dehydrogenase [Candidatus Fermentibacterota bacterium]
MRVLTRTAFLTVALAASCAHSQEAVSPLPEPDREGGTSIEEALEARRSVRRYSDRPLTLAEVGQLLWAAQGITSQRDFRTAPSAGALFPFTVYLVAGEVEGLEAGAYRYLPEEHGLEPVASGDRRADLQRACLDQGCVGSAPASLVLVAEPSVTTSVYSGRGMIYVHMEAGHISQNVYLQCESLGLGTVAVGALDPAGLRDVLGLSEELVPLYVMPLGALPQRAGGGGRA